MLKKTPQNFNYLLCLPPFSFHYQVLPLALAKIQMKPNHISSKWHLGAGPTYLFYLSLIYYQVPLSLSPMSRYYRTSVSPKYVFSAGEGSARFQLSILLFTLLLQVRVEAPPRWLSSCSKVKKRAFEFEMSVIY